VAEPGSVGFELDLDAALVRLAGMKPLYASLARHFSLDLEVVLGRYQSFVKAGSFAEAAMQMHTLKGSAATLGAMRLAKLAVHLELLCKKDLPEAASKSVLDNFAEVVDSTRKALKTAASELET
jgi:HPt (histidine-containing phosphotransfer) domain-containing protein